MDKTLEHDKSIQVVYALPDRQTTATLPFEPGIAADEWVRRSGIAERHPEVLDAPLVLGAWGEPIDNHYEAKAGDRIEICRPLLSDPRDMRRQLWSEGKVIGGKKSR